MMRDFGEGFSRQGLQLSVLALEFCDKPVWLKQVNAIDLQYLKRFSTGYLGSLVNYLIFLIRERPSVVFTHLFKASLIGVIVGRILKIPTVYVRHHITEQKLVGTCIHVWLDKLTGRLATDIIVMSNAARNWLINEEKVSKSKISVVNQGFDFQNISVELKKQVNYQTILKDHNFNIVCGSRYTPEKGQAILLEAFQLFLADCPEARLTYFGPGDSTWLKSLVKERNLQSFVNVLGPSDCPLALFKDADIVVHPSLVDSFSQLIVEVQAVGGVLIATDIAAASEQVHNGVTGLIVPPNNHKAIYEGILSLYFSEELRQNFRKSAPNRISAKYPLELMIESFVNIATRLANSPRN